MAEPRSSIGEVARFAARHGLNVTSQDSRGSMHFTRDGAFRLDFGDAVSVWQRRVFDWKRDCPDEFGRRWLAVVGTGRGTPLEEVLNRPPDPRRKT